ncbi:MAG: isoprenyl transferase [Eubacteriales bacterium]|nr:isoprenyl transferase [Eubacteriales bacterium]
MKPQPAHVAIIMDGNGRWAKKHLLSVASGHRKGVETLREIIRFSSDNGIKVLTLFAFSTENWSRSKEEVSALMQLILEYFKSEIDELHKNNVIIRIIGDIDGLPKLQRETVLSAMQKTASNTGMYLNIALNYGGRGEILSAAKKLCKLYKDDKISLDDINEDNFQDLLYTKGQPPVDLLIRTSGEMRISNFLLYQCAYAEFIFNPVLWPDYTVEEYKKDLKAYMDRDRRFGGRTQ